MNYTEKEISISEIENLLASGKRIEIDTPDGWQPVTEYGKMGEKQTYSIIVEGIETIVAEDHQIETNNGWKKAKELSSNDLALTREGFRLMEVKRNDVREVVDITIDHPNHRYYSNNISSHNCHYTAEMAQQGFNVLYVTMEMSEAKISQRIDANLMDLTIDELETLDEDVFINQINAIKLKGLGTIIVKEYPTAGAHMGNVEALIRDLKNKKGFIPDIVCLDYLNICASRRVSLNKAGMYLFVKSIAEEFRGLAIKYNFVGLTATQGNRGTIESTDIGMQDTSESKGINDTLDFYLAMMAPEEIATQGLMLCKQLKSRYADINKPKMKRFMMTYIREKMLFGEVENTDDFIHYTEPNKPPADKPLFDRSTNDRFLTGDNVKSVLGNLQDISF